MTDLGPGRCRLELRLAVTPTGADRLLAPLLRRMLDRNLAADLARLKALVERTPVDLGSIMTPVTGVLISPRRGAGVASPLAANAVARRPEDAPRGQPALDHGGDHGGERRHPHAHPAFEGVGQAGEGRGAQHAGGLRAGAAEQTVGTDGGQLVEQLGRRGLVALGPELGPIRSVQGLAAATAALGHDVHVYTTNIDGGGVCDVATGAPIDLNGVKVWYFPGGLGRKIFRSPKMGRALDETISTFDIVHIHYVWVWTSIRAAAAARRRSVPYVFAPRGMFVADLIRRRSSLAKMVWLALFSRRDVADAAAIHVTSDIEAADFQALRLPARRLAVIPNGVDVPVDGTNEAAGGEAFRDAEQPYILFLGRISWKKGLDRLISAFPAVKYAKLVIAGYDENGYQAVIERLATDHGLSDRVKFVGPVEGHKKRRLIFGASCLVLPSYNENFGMAVVEAMAAGRPVVVSEEVGLASVVRRTGSGIVVRGEPGALATALNYILSDKVEAQSMGVAGRRVAQELFSWSTVAMQTEQLYLECASPAPPV